MKLAPRSIEWLVPLPAFAARLKKRQWKKMIRRARAIRFRDRKRFLGIHNRWVLEAIRPGWGESVKHKLLE